MVSKKKLVATTAVASFGAAMTTMYLAPEMQADIVDITWSGGNATATNPFFAGSGTAQSFDMDQVATASTSADFVMWNDTFNGSGRTMSIGAASLGIASHRIASDGEMLDPGTFSGLTANNLGGGSTGTGGGEFDGSGTAFVGFREAATGNVGWYQMSFTVAGPVIYGPGQLGSMGEVVTVGGATGNVLLGDVNLDGVVDLLDVGPFVALITTNTFQAEGDINEDGVVDLLDVAPFVDILTGG